MIEVKSLNKYYNKGRPNEIHVINGIDLSFKEKGMVAIFGRSGCGKTTLLNAIGGLDSFQSGSIFIDGDSIKKNPDVVRNRYIGYIFQNYNLNKSESCYDNVADALRLLGMKDGEEVDTRVTAALKNVGMDKFKNRLPDTLSGGQQQRIAIARAIVKNPRIILADEPTGNLDEANTVMVMDLLKKISEDHLVILVTHEAKLVDYYCDTVIELSDGKVVNIRENQSANGYESKNKNNIYLGEYERSELSSENAVIEFYGDAPEEPIKLKIVNENGKFFIRIDTPGVNVIDDSCERKLVEGVYTENSQPTSENSNIDMSLLPEIDGKHHGKLFSFASSLKSGFISNFIGSDGGKKSKKALRRVLTLFSAVLVLMTSILGTSIGAVIDVNETYNHNVFYVRMDTPGVDEALNELLASDKACIDSHYITPNYYGGVTSATFMQGYFETFDTLSYDSSFKTSCAYLDVELVKDIPLLAGKKDGLCEEEIIITRSVAQELLEKSSLGYVREIDDLIGMVSVDRTIDGVNYRIAGVVDSQEKSVYMSSAQLAKVALQVMPLRVSTSDVYSNYTKKGKALLAYSAFYDASELPCVGEAVVINGVPIVVGKIVKLYEVYNDFVKDLYPEHWNSEEYLCNLYQQLYPDSTLANDPEYYAKYSAFRDEKYYEYKEAYFSHLDEYIKQYSVLYHKDFYGWLYLEKGFDDARFFFAEGDSGYYTAVKYKEKSGKYPKLSQIDYGEIETLDIYGELYFKYQSYEDEFYRLPSGYGSYFGGCSYYLSDEDYLAVSRNIGLTSISALTSYSSDSQPQDINVTLNGVQYTVSNAVKYNANPGLYTVIHSSDPSQTEKLLKEKISDVDNEDDWFASPFVTPDDICRELLADSTESIVADTVSLAVIIVVMSLCMLFIMRSSIIARIKEIGIYRAVGVSKKNLLFRFTVETLVLTTLTVFVGYLCMSAFVIGCCRSADLFKTIFFYPWWMAGSILLLLYALCLFCGLAPIRKLLRKTPSEILAKYDI